MTQILEWSTLATWTAPTSTSSAYRIGGYAAIAVLALLVVIFLKRVLRPDNVAPTFEPSHNAAPAPATSAPPTTSAAPPGFAAAPAAARATAAPSGYASAQPLQPRYTRRAKTGDKIALGVCLLLLAVAGHRAYSMMHEWDNLPVGFRSDSGGELHASWMDHCIGTTGESTCECLFTGMAAIPPYNSPDGFLALEPVFATVVQTRSAAGVPPAIIGAIRTCYRAAPQA